MQNVQIDLRIRTTTGKAWYTWYRSRQFYKGDNFCNFLFAFLYTTIHHENMPIQIYWKFYH